MKTALIGFMGLWMCAWTLTGLAQPADPLQQGYAAIISVWSYTDKHWENISDVEMQSDELEKALKPHFEAVYRVDNPSNENIIEFITWLLHLHDESAKRIFIYYSGHGFTDQDILRQRYSGYIAGADTPSAWPQRVRSAVPLEKIRDLLKESNAQQVLMVFDSCFSGSVFGSKSPPNAEINQENRRLDDGEIERLLSKPVREIITAGDETERVPSHSPIPNLLIKGLDGAADPWNNGVVTGIALGSYLFANIPRDEGIRLSPMVGKLHEDGFDQGEFLFRVEPKKHETEHHSASAERLKWRRFYMRDIPGVGSQDNLPDKYLVDVGGFANWDEQRAKMWHQKLCDRYSDLDFGIIKAPHGFPYHNIHIVTGGGLPYDTAEWLAKHMLDLRVADSLPEGNGNPGDENAFRDTWTDEVLVRGCG